jgi:hypothetical protein
MHCVPSCFIFAAITVPITISGLSDPPSPDDTVGDRQERHYIGV